jgi:hypothetical protein
MTTKSCRVRMAGPLAGYGASFDAVLKEQRYRQHARMASFSGWFV